MLVLSRKPQESIVIGGNIIVTVLQIDHDRVKIGIEAPAAITILRHELCEEVRSENIRAAGASANFKQLLTLIRKSLSDRR